MTAAHHNHFNPERHSIGSGSADDHGIDNNYYSINDSVSNDSIFSNNILNNSVDSEVIDNEQFAEMRDLLDEDFNDLVQTYISDSYQRLELIKTAQANADNANGFEAAHALKGASANIGATQLLKLSSQLQEACREQQISTQAALIEQLSLALQRTDQEINQRLGQL